MANKQGGIPKQRPNKLILSRTLFLMIVCGIVAFVALGLRLYKIQINDHAYYEQLALEQQTKKTTVSASRGTVTDRNGNTLAISATAYTIFISPYEIQKYEEDVNLIASNLSEILDVDAESVIEKSKDVASWYKTIASKVEPAVAEEVRALKSTYDLKGVHIENDIKRYYPYGSLASHIIGFVGTDGYGLEGIEAEYNKYLSGTDGSIVRLTAADGTEMLFTNYENYNDAEDGNDVTLTIDLTAQNIADKYLEQAIEDYDVQDGGCCLIMDVNTGEIIAMVSKQDYDLNHYLDVSDDVKAVLEGIDDGETYNTVLSEAQYEQWRNMAISDTYEPGSVFKIITLSMALEEGVATESSSYYCGGAVDVIGRTKPVSCWNSAGHGSQTLKEAVQHSCNVAFVNIGLAMGAERFYKYCDAFGLFNPTGLDLAGEENSQWWSEDVFFDKDNLSQLAAASFGQTFNITPIQMITAVSAAVNGGNLMKPYVVKSVNDQDGNLVYANEPTVVNKVVSEETSKTVCEILESVVGEEEGTGKNAYVAGYRVGGKTGTSEKVAQNAATNTKEYIVSFCGIAPADNPQYAVLVLLDNPSSSSGIYVSGGNMAAPVVGNIFSELLPYFEIEPEYTEEELRAIDVTVPKVVDLDLSAAREKLETLGLSYRIVGDGATVTAQLPAANFEVAAGTEVILYAETDVPEETVSVPELYGLTVSEAKWFLADYGLFLDTAGASVLDSEVVISKQSIAAGTEVQFGSIIEVTLVDNGILGRY